MKLGVEQAMFAAPMAESLAGEVVIDGIRPAVFRQLLQFLARRCACAVLTKNDAHRFIYTGICQWSGEHEPESKEEKRPIERKNQNQAPVDDITVELMALAHRSRSGRCGEISQNIFL